MDDMDARSLERRKRLVRSGQILLLAGTYVLAGRFGLKFGNFHESITLIWPATGISLAALILYGRHLWPGVFLGAFLVNLVSSGNAPAALGIAIGNTLESWVGVTLLCRVADLRPTFERPRDVTVFLLVGVIGSTILSAILGVASLAAFDGLEVDRIPHAWLVWWLGDAGGALALTPALLLLARGSPPWPDLLRRSETGLVLVCLLIATGSAFFGPEIGILGFAAAVSPIPILVWSGIRLGPRGSAMTSFIMISIAAAGTSLRSGPFVLGTTTEAILLLWAYSMLVGTTALTLAAVIQQRDAAERRYRSEEAERIRSERQKGLLLERERLTREMHDGLGGQLVSVLSMVERGSATRGEIAEALRRTIDEIRIVIDSLDPNATDLPTALGRLRTRLEPLLRRNDIRLSWQIDEIPALRSFPPSATLHVLRIIQEGVTNTLRHAGADLVEVRMTRPEDRAGRVTLTIQDDGRGFSGSAETKGRGVRNMTSRAIELGGALRIDDSNPGTKISLTLPTDC
ncbi:MAG TPA: hypothetical protein ENI85_17270 [Deltaproteobacteria bacterium]|nr:hypothetical protein [Deltaproteobacteria bacterium]